MVVIRSIQILLCCYCGAAVAGAGDYITSVGWQYATSSGMLDDSVQNYSIDVKPKINLGNTEKGELRVDGRLSWLSQGESEKIDTSSLNAYYAYDNDYVNIRLGNQSLLWGKADGINPSAFLSPSNYNSFYINDEDRRKSITAIKIDVPISENRATFIVAKKGVYNSIPLNADIPIAINDKAVSGAHYLARYELQNLRGFDGAITLFSGSALNKNMVLEGYDFILNQPKLVFDDVYINALGLDGATNVGEYGLRAELAYVKSANNFSRYPKDLIQDYITTVFGVDRAIGDWQVGLQGLVSFIPNYIKQQPVNVFADLVNTYNNSVNNQQSQAQYGSTLNLSLLSPDQIKPELSVVHFFNLQSTYLKASIKYSIDDRQSFMIGTELFAGDTSTFFGALKQNNKLVMGYKYYF